MLPNLIIIGGMKCGTTSLHYYLNQHPQIRMSGNKELDFFIDDPRFNWHKGLDWYQSHFTGQAKIHGESSPHYTSYPRLTGIPGRMHKIVPHAKLIYLVRDPIARMVSQYIHMYADDWEDRPFEEALSDLENNYYLCRSMYYMQLEQYLAYYAPSQILVICAEDLRDRRRQTLASIFEFLGVDPHFYSWHYERRLNDAKPRRRKTATGQWLAKTPPGKLLQRVHSGIRWYVEPIVYRPFSYAIERPLLSEQLRKKLVDKLTEDVNQIRAFTGINFKNWQI
jgi:hypothetical protein